MKKHELLKSLQQKGFSKKIIEAFEKVPRENFVLPDARDMAYDDVPLPIGEGQTISQPYTIALMLSQLELKPGQKVLELGSGSGYVLALLSELVGSKGKVFGVERISQLAERSKEALEDYENVTVYSQSGASGLPEQAPFDRIIISAALREIPEEIMSQLNTKGGILVAPKGSRFEQDLIVIERHSETEFEMKKRLPGFVFVPFIGDEN